MDKKLNDNIFCIAGFRTVIRIKDSASSNLIPSFEPFRVPYGECAGEDLFTLTEDDTIRRKKGAELIGTFSTGNGDTTVEKFDDGGYQFVIRNIDGNDCCLLQSNKDFDSCTCALNGTMIMRSYGLNNALMFMFAFSGSRKEALLIHASLVKKGKYGYAFIAKSGTGKSTHTSLWLKHIEGSELMNDDNPVIRIIDDIPYVYGSPWSGKTPCYRNVKAELGAVVRIDRAKENSIDREKPISAFASLLPSCSSMKWEPAIYRAICDNITKLIEKTPVYTLHCKPDKEAALLCYKTIVR